MKYLKSIVYMLITVGEFYCARCSEVWIWVMKFISVGWKFMRSIFGKRSKSELIWNIFLFDQSLSDSFWVGKDCHGVWSFPVKEN